MVNTPSIPSMSSTMVLTTVNVFSTLTYPTPSQSLGTPTPIIIPAGTSCSPCIKRINTIISTIIETKEIITVTITTTAQARALCTLPPNGRVSKSRKFITKSILSTVQPCSVTGLSTQLDQIEDVKHVLQVHHQLLEIC